MRNSVKIIMFLFLAAAVVIAGCSRGSSGSSKFAGSYSGTFTGASSGTWTATIGKDGKVDAVMTDPDVGSFKLVGEVNSDGAFAGGGGVAQINRVSWDGVFKIEEDTVTCSGSWESSTGPYGTWSGERD